MARSFLSQLLQVDASASYNDGVASPHTVGVAEAQTSLEGDMNVVRTLLKDLIGSTNWYDQSNMTVNGITDKYFVELLHVSGFETVNVTGGSTTAFDTAIKTITGHGNGTGNSTTTGIVVDATLPHKLSIRQAGSNDPVDDGSNNEVYGRLSWSGTEYTVTFYSDVSGTETPYTFASATDIDLAYVAKSSRYEDLSWERFLDFGFHDVSGLVGTLNDDSVVVDGMTYLLSGLTTQAQVNTKLDNLGNPATGQGASLIAIEDASSYWTGTDVETALDEILTQIGGTTSTTYDFTENNVLADNDYVYPALDKLDLKWGDLASTSVGEGATLVGLVDAGGNTTETTVEGAISELYGLINDVSGWIKVSETTSGTISSGTSHTIPGGNTFTPAAGGLNMDIYLSGQLLLEGVGNDYTEDVGGTSVTFLFTVPTGKNITYQIRK